ncbi:MAG: TolC family outer membrane protein [Candidatus Paracaedibacter sp.]
MKNQHPTTRWSLKLGILGLALSVSPLSMNLAYAAVSEKQATAEIIKPSEDALDKAAAARIPEGRATVTNIEAALEAAYRNNTELKELQAQLRSRDEGVPQALAGWRPTVYANASVGGEKDILSGDLKTDADNNAGTPRLSGKGISTASADITLAQNLFNGGKTVAETCKAENAVLTARAQLADKEREILFNAVKAYFEVIARTSELNFKKSNELAFKKTLEATQDKFNVGEETRTSIAQAQADLANATAQRELTEAQLLAAEATFEQVTGARPGKLKKPNEAFKLPGGLKEAIEIAKKNNPAILSALYQEKVDRHAIKSNDAGLLPQIDLQASVKRQSVNTGYNYVASNYAKTNDLTTAQTVSLNLKVPIYEGGVIRGKSRELREIAEQRRIMIETARRKVIQQLVSAWETFLASKANLKNYEIQVKANEVALEGTRQEMLVGSKILLDVLNAQRLLVQSQLNLVQAEQQYHQAAYDILANMGRLNVTDMKLKVKRYNEQVHYQDVRNSW